MSSGLLSWIDTPAETRPRWPNSISQGQMVELCRWLMQMCKDRSLKAGDDADRAADFLRSFLRAIQQSSRHGQNWLARYGLELNMFLVTVLPDILGSSPVGAPARKADPELVGDELMACAVNVFRGAIRGPVTKCNAKYVRSLDDLISATHEVLTT